MIPENLTERGQVRLSDAQQGKIDTLIMIGHYATQSEFIRAAVEQKLRQYDENGNPTRIDEVSLMEKDRDELRKKADEMDKQIKNARLRARLHEEGLL